MGMPSSSVCMLMLTAMAIFVQVRPSSKALLASASA